MTIAYVDTSWLIERRSGLWGSRSLPRDHAAFLTSVATRVEVACRLPVRHLKSLDAIHVATALITRCDIVLTSDRQMARACEELGLQVA